ncbi:MAG TPA: hypothetical protein VMF89_13180, partial [Polyangiales bacterium]|nr:hypothetical protein [Polyangiales bacterium]
MESLRAVCGHKAAWLLVTQAPRVLMFKGAALLALLLSGSGCVSSLRYEEAVSAAEVEAEARKRTVAELQSAQARVVALENELAMRDQRVAAEQRNVEESRYEQGVLAKQKQEEGLLVQQLRADLERANQSLVAYADEKVRLERELSSVREQSVKQDPLERLASDVERKLRLLSPQKATLVKRNGNSFAVVLEAEQLFEPAAAVLRSGFGSVFEVLGRTLREKPELTLEVRENASDAALPAALGGSRRERMSELLTAAQL